jgi:hypothetical protein
LHERIQGGEARTQFEEVCAGTGYFVLAPGVVLELPEFVFAANRLAVGVDPAERSGLWIGQGKQTGSRDLMFERVAD